LYDRQLYKLGLNSVLYQCLPSNETFRLLVDLHEGSIRRHFGSNIVVKKILTFGYWWPILYKDIIEMFQTCDVCQHLGPMWQNGKGPFKLIMAFEPFMKWGIDFMGLIKLVSWYIGSQYIIVTINLGSMLLHSTNDDEFIF